jgi:hypothetical protein
MGEAKRRREAARQITDRLVQMGAEHGQFVFLGWAAFQEVWMKGVSDTKQLQLAKDAYYSGAQHTFHSLMSLAELPEHKSERIMHLLNHELTVWYEEQSKHFGIAADTEGEKH